SATMRRVKKMNPPEKKRKKKKMELVEDEKPKGKPRTIENTREYDETMVASDDEEIQYDIQHDEMESYFKQNQHPKVLITTSDNPHTRTIQLAREFKQIIPKAEFRFRNRSSIKKIIRGCIERDYTDIILINENRREPNGMLLVHLPDGPTAKFRMSSVKLTNQLKHAVKSPPFNRPEVILNEFNTRLGHTIGRMFACLFPQLPKFQYRSVCTFHNQRDYIFFRYHRYDVDTSRGKVQLQECGPQFTLKLMLLQKGTFDPKYGEYEWMLKRHEMQKSRKRANDDDDDDDNGDIRGDDDDDDGDDAAAADEQRHSNDEPNLLAADSTRASMAAVLGERGVAGDRGDVLTTRNELHVPPAADAAVDAEIVDIADGAGGGGGHWRVGVTGLRGDGGVGVGGHVGAPGDNESIASINT
ncbi:Ribosome production factor 1, partial [Fragariocoptes setiger]